MLIHRALLTFTLYILLIFYILAELPGILSAVLRTVRATLARSHMHMLILDTVCTVAIVFPLTNVQQDRQLSSPYTDDPAFPLAALPPLWNQNRTPAAFCLCSVCVCCSPFRMSLDFWLIVVGNIAKIFLHKFVARGSSECGRGSGSDSCCMVEAFRKHFGPLC